LEGSGEFADDITDWKRVAEPILEKGQAGDTCEVLFWAKGIHHDLMARTIFEFNQKTGDKTVDYKYDQFQHYFCSIKNDWMRIRIPFILRSDHDQIMPSVLNKVLKNFKIVIDDVVIRKKL